MNIVIKNARVITMNEDRTVLKDGAIVIEGSTIKEICSMESLAADLSGYEIYDAEGCTALPGLVNTHTHLFQSLWKGLGDDRVLIDWFQKVTGPSSAVLEPEDCYLAAQLGALESIRSGATCLLDFMYPHHMAGLSEPIIKALGSSGLRAIFARGFIDYGENSGVPSAVIEKAEDALADIEQLFETYNDGFDGRMQVWMAPCMIWSQTEQGLRQARELSRAKKIPVTIHVAETPFELENAMQRFGKKDLEYLESIDFLGPDLLAVHCVYLDERDLRILKNYDIKVSHNPTSNMYLSSGVAPIPQMLLAGITVGLATDGPASNNNQSMLSVLKMTALLHKVSTKDPTVLTAEKVLEMATIDGARALGLQEETGSLEVGKKADLIIADLNTPFTRPVLHPVSTLVYSALGDEIKTMLVGGEFVMKDGKVLTIDEEEVLQQVQKRAEDLMKRANTVSFSQRPWRSQAF